MAHAPLYPCTRLHARITLAHCESNRSRNDTPQMTTRGYPVVRPRQCRDCTDWKAWGKEVAPVQLEGVAPAAREVDMAKKKAVCKACNKEKPITGRGMCGACYQRVLKRERMESAAVKPAAVKSEATYGVEQLFSDDRDTDLLVALQEAARINYRTVQGEVLFRLRSSLSQGGGLYGQQ